MELFQVVSVDEAKDIINNSFNYKLEAEELNILESVGRTCFEDVKSKENIPEFKRSTVDGFAVNSKDVFGASEAVPAILDFKGEILMGKVPSSDIEVGGQCMYVPTGGMLPKGADTVIMVEYSDKLDENSILIYSPAAPGDNVIQVGEDISAGDIVIKKGDKLRPYEIGVLASLGITKIKVFKRPKVAVISTGDEIVSCEVKPALGEIRDINTYLLYTSLIEDGLEPVSYGIIKDDFQLLKNTVDKALKECEIVLISGGSSVGKKDQSLKVINSYEDAKLLIHGIAVKPGKPTIVGKVRDKIIFGLPGHPLACSIIYKTLVKTYIEKLMDKNEKLYPIKAVMSINYHKAKGREEYLPVELQNKKDGIIAVPIFGKAGLITSFSRAWGYIKIEKDVEGLKEGEKVEVYKI